MHYTVYKITNKINGKFYIGTHKTEDLNDNYMGSGTLLKRAIQKHGLDNFEKEILFVFDNAEDMFAKEAEIVTEDFLAEENTYNLKIGGFGGWDYLNQPTEFRIKKNQLGRIRANESNQINYGIRNISQFDTARRLSSERMKNLHTGGKIKYKTFSGKKHSDETRAKIASKNAINQAGSKNSQYGKMWITNGIESKSVLKTHPIPEGWYKGRKIKNLAS